MDATNDGTNWLRKGYDWRKNFANISRERTDLTEPTNEEIELELEYENSEESSKEKLLRYIEKQVIGSSAVFDGPFGPRQVLYCDYVASGKALGCIEQFMMKHVLPMYANTHTTTTVTSSQTTSLRTEAKDIIRKALGANDDDVVIFTGSGVTGAVHKLISVLDLKLPPVIFCGPFEHHSNLLPWRQLDGHVINITETSDGNVNLHHLEVALRTWCHSGRPMIGSFSAASNITGVTTDTRKVAGLLHKYGAISLWDYATGAPYMDIQMHPDPINGYDTSKDAVFISMHKFVGSPDAPGLLVASKDLFRNAVPSGCGGGTVLFVSEFYEKYLKDIESREEGGTPAIIGSIRAGLAFKMKMSVSCDVIMAREDELYKRAMEVWKDIPELEILGIQESQPTSKSSHQHKLAIFSFLIRHPQTGYYLHYNYVAALLNDLFGIQTRGGCACAGVYASRLLGIDKATERRFLSVLEEDPKRAKQRSRLETERTEYEVLRPGFTRLNLAYFLGDDDADFIISSVALVARQGWTLLPQYTYGASSGEWKHVDSLEEISKKRLEDVSFGELGFNFPDDTNKRNHAIAGLPTSRINCLKRAERIFANASKVTGKMVEDQRPKFARPKVRDLRWFLLPYEAQSILKGKRVEARQRTIFLARRKIHQLTDDEIRRQLSKGNPRVAQLPHATDPDDNDGFPFNKNMHANGSLRGAPNGVNGVVPHSTKGGSEKRKKGTFKSFFKALTCQNEKSVQVM